MQREYPSAPIAGVAAVVISRNDAGESCVLLVRRGREPLRGQWSLPGGVLELGETLQQGVVREVLEETGLEVSVLAHVESFDRIARDSDGRVRYHYVLSDWLCNVTGGTLQCGDDADEAAWLTQAEIEENSRCPLDAFTREVIAKAWKLLDAIA